VNSNKQLIPKNIPERELRSNISSVSNQTETRNTNRHHFYDCSKPTTTPILGRKIVKTTARRSNSVKTSSSSSKTKKK